MQASKPAVPTLLAPEAGFVEDSLSMEWWGDGFRMIQAHYIYCALISIIISAPPQTASGIRSQKLGTLL